MSEPISAAPTGSATEASGALAATGESAAAEWLAAWPGGDLDAQDEAG